MKKVPKVKFLLPSIKEDAKTLSMFCVPMITGWDWSNQVFKYHPKLKEMINGSKNKKFISMQCLQYTKSIRKIYKVKFKKIQKNYQDEWNKINNIVMNNLSEHFETEWFQKNLVSFISICPIFPRNLKLMTFNVNFGGNVQFMKQVCSHEILHFLWFKKWKEVFPKTKGREMDAPFLVWKVSEIMAPIILNHHPKFKKMLGGKCMNYSEFDKVKIGKISVNKFFESIYKKYLNNKEPFDSFLKEIWKNAIKNKKALEAI